MKKESIEENLVEYSDEELNAIKDPMDWKRVNAMTDEDIDAASEDAPLTEEELDQFEPVMYIDGVDKDCPDCAGHFGLV